MNDDELVEGELIGPELREQVPDADERNIRDEGFAALTREERVEMARRSHAVRRAKKRAKQLADLKAYMEAHQDLASQLLGAKMTLLDGLIAEMDDGSGNLDTTRLDDKRMKLLMQLMEQMEKRAFGNTVQRTETKSEVDIRAAVVDLTKALKRPDSV